ncbi:MAG: ABC transporter ATP-binding protein [Methanomicrobiales archaeon]|nr:ABC transporter ATP-binding protein [Methanomicrobiales archaeon]
MTILMAGDLTFSYGRKPVLEGIDLECRRGEVLGILGQNGSGKTTLLRLLAGYLKPERGSVLYRGTDISAMSSSDLARIRAVVGQSAGVNFDFPVADFVMLGRTPYLSRFGRESAHDFRMVEQALDLTDTGHLQDRLISRLSGGELQRVTIARALAQEPEILMLDEPTSHLDVRHQLEIMDLLGKLSRSMTVITIVHDLNSAFRHCGRVALLHRTHLHSCGPPEEVLTPEAIREVFSVRASRAEGPDGGGPLLSFSLPPPDPDRRDVRVHVISGGGYGRTVLHALAGRGYQVSAGVLNEGDLDLDVAQYLGCRVITAPPFSRIGENERRRMEEVAREADAIVVVAMPVGEGNIENIRFARDMAAGVPVILYAPSCTLSGLDYAGGEGDAVYGALRQRAILACSLGELIDRLAAVTT